jgi:aspartyl-tRNA(Asn)/glutamyl-tRNA(Gln) amidotransferase subunit A
MDSTSIEQPAPVLRPVLGEGVEGLRVGRITDLPPGADPDVEERLELAFEALERAGAKTVDVTVPAFSYGLTAYYLIAPAEASSNLARYDGVRYGLRVDAPDTAAMNAATREAGFGAEVKRRIMLGTYALSAGYYEAYYGKALKVRRLIADDFAHGADRGVPLRRQDGQPAGDVPLRRVHDPFPAGRPSRHQRAVRHRPGRVARRRAGPRARAG